MKQFVKENWKSILQVAALALFCFSTYHHLEDLVEDQLRLGDLAY
jgi:hypothetical protein